jgi:hypothetical protein
MADDSVKIGGKEVERSFLVEGIQSYRPAFDAIQEFHRLLSACSKEILLRRLQALSESMGIPLTKSQILSYANPVDITAANRGWNGAWIGAHIKFKNDMALYLGVVLTPDEPDRYKASAQATMWFRDPKAIEILEQEAGTTWKRYGKELSIGDRLDAENLDQTEALLEQSLDSWIRLWGRLGGYPGLLDSMSKTA